jgi:transposase
VPPKHPVRFVRDFVDTLDLGVLGIKPSSSGDEGRPAYAPDLLLKVWLFGYMERIRSTRGLEKACLQVMPFLWLTGNLHPDHNTLWRFFNKHREHLPKLFRELMKASVEAGLVGFVLHALDGTKLGAASSTDEALHRKSVTEKLAQLDEFIASYMQEVSTQAEEDKGQGYAMPEAMTNEEARRAKIRQSLERRIEEREEARNLGQHGSKGGKSAEAAAQQEILPPSQDTKPRRDDDEPPQGGGSAGTEPPSPSGAEPKADPLEREAKALREELLAKLAVLDAAKAEHVHEREPEARMMKGRGTGYALGYNAQIVVDHDSDLIVSADVVADQNDTAQLTPMLLQVYAAYGRVAERSVTDGGFASGEELKRAEEHKLPVLVGLREEPETKGEYSKAFFRYEAADDVYVCPRGERLVQIGTNKSHATSKHPDAIYRCKNKTCPVREACSKDPKGRKIRRPYGEDARERQAALQRDPQMAVLLGLRKEIVEHLFGIVKAIDGFRRFTVRGLEKARAQWTLVCMAVNLRKLSAMATWRDGVLTKRSWSAPAALSSGAAG